MILEVSIILILVGFIGVMYNIAASKNYYIIKYHLYSTIPASIGTGLLAVELFNTYVK